MSELDMWEDAPARARESAGTREKLAEELAVSAIARRHFSCPCGAKIGEPCVVDSRDAQMYSPREMEWLRTFDAHVSRRARWTGATELERAMIRAAHD
jgi:hypothetical protein